MRYGGVRREGRGAVAALVASLLACAPAGDREATRTTSAAITACEGAPVSPARYLRQLSFDLRGAPPTRAELREVMGRGEVPDATIEGFLRDPRFLERVKRWHADLLWPNIGGFQLRVGGNLVVAVGPNQLSASTANPERIVEMLDHRSDEATCPPLGDPANLTAVSCCTADDPDHPACCLLRHAAYDPADPACVARSMAMPATFSYGSGTGDGALRGRDTYLGCDGALEYPPPRVAPTDARWHPDPGGRPTYVAPRSGATRHYYDERDIPLPYDDAAHCPNYCRAATGTGPGGAFARADYAPKTGRDALGRTVEGDGPGFVCPEGMVEVENPCDNVVSTTRMESRVQVRQEGFRLTQPWWAGGRWIKTCAYEAQEREQSLDHRIPCNLGRFLDRSCGCGPDGRYCAPFTGDYAHPSRVVSDLRDAINREPLEIVASVVGRDEDYATILTTRRGVANGPLAFMNRYQTPRMGELEFTPSAPPEALPDVPASDPTWHEYQRSPMHSGVLTTPAFLARFATRRSRVDRFLTAFLCRPFAPRAGPLPDPGDACNREPNLARRCGCSECHAVIEPFGAAWGRWGERGTAYLAPELFRRFDAACALCVGVNCPDRCRHYVTNAAAGDADPRVGYLQSYLDRTDAETCRIDQGPRTLVADGLATGELQACAARTLWERLLNRPMSESEYASVLPALVRDFEANGRSYRALVRAVVTSAAYRRID